MPVWPNTPQKVKQPLRFLLVRHGESFSNVDLAHNLETPNESVELTPKGWAQAAGCGAFLKDYLQQNPLSGGTAFYHSSYTRTRQTAQAIYDAIAPLPLAQTMRVHELDLLAEHHVGYLHGMSEAELEAHDPHMMMRYRLHLDKGSHQFAPYYGGEMRATVGHRTITFLNLAFREHESHNIGTIIVVSHGRVMQQIMKHFSQLPREAVDSGDTVGNCDVRLFQRHGAGNDGFGDFGSIYENGSAKPAALQDYETAAQRLAKGLYRKS